MADEQNVVRSVSWDEVFSFTYIFKSFKMAIHSGKILLALAGIILTFVIGRFVMDPIAGMSDSSVVASNETWSYWTAPSRAAFLEQKDRWLKDTRVAGLTSILKTLPGISEQEAISIVEKDFNKALRKARKGLKKSYQQALEQIEKDWKAQKKAIVNLRSKKERRKQLKQINKSRIEAQRRALQAYIARLNNLKNLAGAGIFEGFLDWEKTCFSNMIGAIRRGNFVGGVSDLLECRGVMTPAPLRSVALPNRPPFNASTNIPEGYGMLAWLILAGWGHWWMVSIHPVYSAIFLVIALAVWSVFGGAICRMAAIHSARGEKVSMVTALKFSLSKFVSFFTAPLLPLGAIVFLGIVFLSGGGLLGAIPGFGEWFVAILLFLALIIAAIITFLVVGLSAGSPLMWPTIAVEGSDSFDAISRSFSYIYARPFRYGLYWIVAAIYGTICYLFVRLFAFITLRMTHFWTGWAMKLSSRPQYAPGAGKLDVMWANPTFNSFHGPMQLEATRNASEAAASVVLAVWVYLVSAVVIAFGVCLFFSAATNIYYLLRRKVDATDFDDVYIEEEPVEQEVSTTAQEQPAPETSTTPAETTPEQTDQSQTEQSQTDQSQTDQSQTDQPPEQKSDQDESG